MKFKKLLTLSVLGYSGYKLLKHKDEIAHNYQEKSKTAQNLITILDNLKPQVENLKKQLQNLTDTSQVLQYKSRVFKNETQAHLTELSKYITKYQNKKS